MAGPWIFSTLVGLSMLVQLCTAKTIVQPARLGRVVKDRYENPTNVLLRRIMGNVRRISDMLAFQMLEQEDQQAILEEKRASMNPKRKCVLQALVLGKSVDECTKTIEDDNALKDSRRSFSLRKRRPNNNGALNSNSNVNNNYNSNKEDNKDEPEAAPIRKKPRRWDRNTKNGNIIRSKPVKVSQAANTNVNENANFNFNDEAGALNDENEGLSVLSDNDDGPGALNDEIDAAGTLNDENDGPSALNDAAGGDGALNDESFNDNLTFNDEDAALGALNDDYNLPVGGEKLADEFEI
ncbi:uncharacterized protein DDB_G0287625-like [Belonocnema kinseyi]|uniref:uncharacterized protein DDB_G0287625-like n=1 Tax=Belonocnema kinseyi TaxID=2817044 RepID=UPI00143D7A92|nr:uncharacterized protein DDB_G0287625-like [Belonocnema kinseyi]